jgi:hypothetical protein
LAAGNDHFSPRGPSGWIVAGRPVSRVAMGAGGVTEAPGRAGGRRGHGVRDVALGLPLGLYPPLAPKSRGPWWTMGCRAKINYLIKAKILYQKTN